MDGHHFLYLVTAIDEKFIGRIYRKQLKLCFLMYMLGQEPFDELSFSCWSWMEYKGKVSSSETSLRHNSRHYWGNVSWVPSNHYKGAGGALQGLIVPSAFRIQMDFPLQAVQIQQVALDGIYWSVTTGEVTRYLPSGTFSGIIICRGTWKQVFNSPAGPTTWEIKGYTAPIENNGLFM